MATKTSLKRCVQAASNFTALLPSHSFRQMLVNFWDLRTISKFRKRKGGSVSSLHVLHKVVVVQQWQRNVWKSMMLVQSCCFAKLKLSLFCCSRCHHHRSCLRSLICNWPLPTVGAFRPGLATLYVFWSFSGKLKKLLMYENLLTGKNFLTAYKICVH